MKPTPRKGGLTAQNRPTAKRTSKVEQPSQEPELIPFEDEIEKQIDGIDDGKFSLANFAKETKLTLVEDIFTRDQILSIRARTPRFMNVKKGGKIVTVPIVKKVKVGGGKEMDYVPNPYYIRKANNTFGFGGWSFDIVAKDMIEDDAIIHGVLTVYAKGHEIRKSNFGGQTAAREIIAYEKDGTRLKKRDFFKKIARDDQDDWEKIYGKYVDLGNTFKGASTDCFKKCMSMFGFFSDIYAPDDFVEIPEEVDAEQELKTVKKILAQADKKTVLEIVKKVKSSGKYTEEQKAIILKEADHRMILLPDGEPLE